MNYTRWWLISIVVITAKLRYAITCNYDGTFNIAARSCKLKQRVRRPLNQYQSVEYALICLCDIGVEGRRLAPCSTAVAGLRVTLQFLLASQFARTDWFIRSNLKVVKSELTKLCKTTSHLNISSIYIYKFIDRIDVIIIGKPNLN